MLDIFQIHLDIQITIAIMSCRGKPNTTAFGDRFVMMR